jgi:hypothetical protein
VKSQEEMKAQEDSNSESSGVGGLIGGFGRRLARRNSEPTARSTFMTSTSEVLSVSTAVTTADVAIPEGFTERN